MAGPLTPVEQRVLDQIDAGAILDLLGWLVSLPTLSGEEGPGQREIGRRLDDDGFEVKTWTTDVDTIRGHPAYSAEFDRPTIDGVTARAGQGEGPRLLVVGHVDVVPTGDTDSWSTPPFVATRVGDRVQGRGTCDMKGGLATSIHALTAIAAAGVELAGEVVLAPVVGEEDGGSGTLALLQHGVTADACVIPEPTELSVVPAVAGALSWRIRIPGRSAHGCLREEGVSAIERLPAVIAAVQDLERRRNTRDPDPLFGWLDRPYAICGGRVEGGDWPSSEADWLVWEGRYGVVPGEDLVRARREFEDAIAEVTTTGSDWSAGNPPTVEWWGGQFLPARTDPGHAIVTTASAAVTDAVGRPTTVRGMPYGCDMGLTVGVGGIPTVVFGPGDIRDAHRPDESVRVDDLVEHARAMALLALRFCGT